MAVNEETPRPFTPLDMLMPARLLKATDWRDNPLVVVATQHNKTVHFCAMRLSEIFLFAFGALIPVYAFFFVEHFERFVAEFRPGRLDDRVIRFIPAYVPLLYPVFLFLLLRYRLWAGRALLHVKYLSGARMPEILLTNLGPDELFLNPLLTMCRSHTIFYGWGAVWLLALAVDFALGNKAWSWLLMYVWVAMSLNLVALVWVAGIFQYVVEWMWFAGGRPRWRTIRSLAISLALAVAIWGFPLTDLTPVSRKMLAQYEISTRMKDASLSIATYTFIVMFFSVTMLSCAAGALVVTWGLANKVYETAMRRLRSRALYE
ncbi:MAG: hypothetical protein ABFD69_06005 [Candidatus Sumerlaeia bacterium]